MREIQKNSSFRFTPASLKQLKKLPLQIQTRIINKIKYFIASDNPLVFAKHLTDPQAGQYRFRVGKYRIICDMSGKDLIVLDIGHRKDIYKK